MIQEKQKLARKTMLDVRRILLHDWDPDGSGETGSEDEYNEHITQVCHMLEQKGTDAQALAGFLLHIDPMCMEPEAEDRERNLATAKKLLSLKVAAHR